ncbi:dehydrodolichyl diphosphate synthase 6-like [Salvia miltiorrhiza]|uniref:dehydrodolichyl diphosphate synthase 6-like n=1 Tax=Salvia miltiorrhiza TaxID=226208 RepID=UPI0025AC1BC6|nr:dehydrodolichyl diphosphate synthase 6-like [Salvia miltiorrhiza]XP_057804778.1 dehydrodolichyl diphosphate synthase 6-like [Salvia miltiorrhiza]XP_057804779.1 dehydrodolichyl diphosphate synthase 6-like [Salvia miltiorrhiza]XP_057804780.1 dehydrodolichyl diphosphate synthase 6-like [Salvia miltiorrhiza]XP_057804781.1 dehydrodolichyl diphosphate synthase 6-like [Salvia miltiorrhiza]XP_057804782.1 dehydrodolichyl diphosphate synthase 6-like [Salvia miltiorrhiza]XP_057804784.1 dehydrodolichy
MESSRSNNIVVKVFGSSVSYMRRWLFRALSVGAIPRHVAFILDGNRRYARKWNLGEGMGHRAGFLSLMTLMKYCYELGVKYVTIYAFSIDNFKRKPEEVQYVMDLMLEKIEGLLKEESIVNQYGVRVEFVGNLKLLSDPVRLAAEKAMELTAKNSRAILLIAVAYTSTDEIAHAAQQSCLDKIQMRSGFCFGFAKADDDAITIRLGDVESHMYMGVAPDPDILVRTSGETRLSNFLLWQTSNSLLYSPRALWPEMGLRHLVWIVLNFQRVQPYLERRRKLLS